MARLWIRCAIGLCMISYVYSISEQCGSQYCLSNLDCSMDGQMVFCHEEKKICCQKSEYTAIPAMGGESGSALDPPTIGRLGHEDIQLWKQNSVPPLPHPAVPNPENLQRWIPTLQNDPFLNRQLPYPNVVPVNHEAVAMAEPAPESSCAEDPLLVYPDQGERLERSSATRFYYDPSLHRCLAFTYFGHGGNGNNYESFDSCFEKCVRVIADKVSCIGSNKSCRTDGSDSNCNDGEYCQSTPPAFRYGMCCDQSAQDMLSSALKGECGPGFVGVADGKTITRTCNTLECGFGQQCVQINEKFGICCTLAPFDGEHNEEKTMLQKNCGENESLLYPDQGNGPKAYKHYYYDSSLHRCLAFTYKGRGGNGNNFKTFDDCFDQCVAPIADKVACEGSNSGCSRQGACPNTEYCMTVPPTFNFGICCDKESADMLSFALKGECGPGFVGVADGKTITRTCNTLECGFGQQCVQINKKFGICCTVAHFADEYNEAHDDEEGTHYEHSGTSDEQKPIGADHRVTMLQKNCGEDKSLSYPDQGNGPMAYTHYYYDSSLHRCLAFTYKGSGGNGNNFETFDGCFDRCVAAIADKVACEGSNNGCSRQGGVCPNNAEYCMTVPPTFNFGICCDKESSEMLSDALKGKCSPAGDNFGAGDGQRIARNCSTLICNAMAPEQCKQINPKFAICCPI